jgi:hypothetical protein
MDLLEAEGGGASIARLASQFGLDTSQAGKLIGALSPALLGGLQQQVQSDDTRAGLANAIRSGKHQRYLDEPDSLTDEATRDDGNSILGHLFGSKEVSRNVAAQASEQTGLDTSLIKKALPLVAGLAMAAMSRKASAEGDDAEGGLGSLTALLAGSDGKFDLNDVRNFGRRIL